MQRHAVHAGGHPVLADAEMDVTAAIAARGHGSHALDET